VDSRQRQEIDTEQEDDQGFVKTLKDYDPYETVFRKEEPAVSLGFAASAERVEPENKSLQSTLNVLDLKSKLQGEPEAERVD
jgi:hypothetical protein